MERRLNRRLTKPLAILAITFALLLGVVLGLTTGIADRILGGPDPRTIASASLESMRAQNRLIVFVARYVSVTSSRQDRLGGLISSERTLILPGDVRYELDLSKLQPDDLSWDAGTNTLRVQLPEIEIAGPDVDLAAAREYGSDGVLSALTNAEERLDQANRAAAVADLRKQASGEVPMNLARQAARQAIEWSFAMPLKAAGYGNVKVVARFAGDPEEEPSYWDVSTSYNEAIREAERRRAAEGQR